MRRILLLTATLMVATTSFLLGQGVTNAALSGKITDQDGSGLPGANVVATHTPSGTTYGTISLTDGRFTIQGMRIGGPYTIKVSFVGYKEAVYNDVYLSLGSATNINVALSEEATELEAVVVSANRSDLLVLTEREREQISISKRLIHSQPSAVLLMTSLV